MPLAIGDLIPYGIWIAPSEGSIAKGVKAIYIAPEEGSINKAITGVYIAPSEGAINKKVRIGGVRLGDVNGDGTISISDYSIVRLHNLGLSILSIEKQFTADVTQDGAVTTADETALQAYIAGGGT